MPYKGAVKTEQERQRDKDRGRKRRIAETPSSSTLTAEDLVRQKEKIRRIEERAANLFRARLPVLAGRAAEEASDRMVLFLALRWLVRWCSYGPLSAVMKQREWKNAPGKGETFREAILRHAATLNDAELRGLVVQVLASTDVTTAEALADGLGVPTEPLKAECLRDAQR
jgi:hypothetical protein